MEGGHQLGRDRGTFFRVRHRVRSAAGQPFETAYRRYNAPHNGPHSGARLQSDGHQWKADDGGEVVTRIFRGKGEVGQRVDRAGAAELSEDGRAHYRRCEVRARVSQGRARTEVPGAGAAIFGIESGD